MGIKVEIRISAIYIFIRVVFEILSRIAETVPDFRTFHDCFFKITF